MADPFDFVRLFPDEVTPSQSAQRARRVRERDKAVADFADRFIGWIGSGYNARGQFPHTLSELSTDIAEFVALAARAAPRGDAAP